MDVDEGDGEEGEADVRSEDTAVGKFGAAPLFSVEARCRGCCAKEGDVPAVGAAVVQLDLFGRLFQRLVLRGVTMMEYPQYEACDGSADFETVIGQMAAIQVCLRARISSIED